MTARQKAAIALASLVVLLSRLAHLHLVWVEEAYGMAAGSQLLRGKHLYSDIWFDKPPVYAWFYLLNGALPGWPLRLLDTAFTLAVAWSIAQLTRTLWRSRPGSPEPVLAFVLTCISLTFWIPSAVMAIAPDQLVLLPIALAISFAAEGKSTFGGLASGFAVLCNPKGLIALPIVLLWTWRDAFRVIGAFASVQVASVLLLPIQAYWQEVWRWGFAYSANTFVTHPILEGLRRTGSWAGFHLALVASSLVGLLRTKKYRLWAALLLSCIAVIGGMRFFPRYYFLLLPIVIAAASHGLYLLSRTQRAAVLCLLVIPIVRFGPRYMTVALKGPGDWSDAALMEDSRAVAAALGTAQATSNDSLLVWGYRPDIYVFSGLPAGTQFLDSQPLTGVIADRHLTVSTPTFPELARENRRELIRTRPTFIVDGLGIVNPALSITNYPDLRDWWQQYIPVAATKYSAIYQLRDKRN